MNRTLLPISISLLLTACGGGSEAPSEAPAPDLRPPRRMLVGVRMLVAQACAGPLFWAFEMRVLRAGPLFGVCGTQNEKKTTILGVCECVNLYTGYINF